MPTTETPVVLDASAAIVLFATERCLEIVDAWPGAVFVAPEVVAEAAYLRHPTATDPSDARVPIDWAPILATNAITILTRTDPAEFATFVRLALLVDDGEAAAGAAAIQRGLMLVLDDRKARRMLTPEIPVLWSLDLVLHWCRTRLLPAPDVATVLERIRRRARYQPHDGHPHWAWWSDVLDRP